MFAATRRGQDGEARLMAVVSPGTVAHMLAAPEPRARYKTACNIWKI